MSNTILTNSRSSLTDGVSSYLQIRPLPSYSQEIKKCRLDDIKLNIGGNIIKIEKKVRFLGVIFDREMTWVPHVDYVVARCSKRLNLMKVMAEARWGASKSILLIVYKALIRSVIDYGCIVYDSASDTVKARQTGRYSGEGTEDLLWGHGWHTNISRPSRMRATSFSSAPSPYGFRLRC